MTRAKTGLGFGLDWPTFSESFGRDDSQRGVKRHRKMLRRKGIVPWDRIAGSPNTNVQRTNQNGKVPYSRII